MTAALLTALEGAEEGSSELDAQIALSIGWTHEAWPEQRERKPWWRKPETPRGRWYSRYEEPPRFSQSIDAALSLVPEGYGVLMATFRGKAKASISRGYLGDIEAQWPGDGEAPTLALAIVKAALRARLAATGTVEE